MRTIIDLRDDQLAGLSELCRREGISRAEAVRRGVELLLAQRATKEQEFERAMSAAFGIWKDRGIDSVEYQRQLRAEWERD